MTLLRLYLVGECLNSKFVYFKSICSHFHIMNLYIATQICIFPNKRNKNSYM